MSDIMIIKIMYIQIIFIILSHTKLIECYSAEYDKNRHIIASCELDDKSREAISTAKYKNV